MNLASGLEFLFSMFSKLFDSLIRIEVYGVSIGVMIVVSFIVRQIFVNVFEVRPTRVRVNPNSPGTKTFPPSESR